MRSVTLVIALLLAPALSRPALAQQPSGSGGRTALWTAVGAGFGIGLWAGLSAFDDAIDSDRKVWTSAIVGAAAGGALGYLLTRGKGRPKPSRGARAPVGARVQARPLDDVDLRTLAASTRLGVRPQNMRPGVRPQSPTPGV